MTRTITTVALIAASAFLLPVLSSAAPLKGAVDSPKAGVLCDRKAGFCADSEGISMGLTKLYLGEEAEQKMILQTLKLELPPQPPPRIRAGKVELPSLERS